MPSFDRTQLLRKLWGCFEFRRQAFSKFVKCIGRKPASGQKPVKLRGRQIEILRNLLELRPRHPVQLVLARTSGEGGFEPPQQSGASRPFSCNT